ncbi:hypothetical protein [Marininema halotolerans]|uniref:Uncharacterized protein n=1 Tax=Marininema halotolerans TaxID=1155944 RepID=A0A1I6QJ18_9BACL|nr:hypothetical protein [Marininema halotolerans]SFS52402.1 hypothetical protein SAMN05444972_103181 [Marininema halotolerans]
MTYKNVYFHKMRMYKASIMKNGDSADSYRKDYKETKQLDEIVFSLLEIDDVNTDDKDIKNQYKCIRLGRNENADVFELLWFSDEYIFARMGRYKNDVSVHLRDMGTLKPSPISKEDNQELEIFTYLLIDRDNYLVSYLREQSAPSIQMLSNLINNNCVERNLCAEISSIIIEDAIPLLKNKEIIGSMEYTIEVPSGELNIDEIGLGESDFEHLSNQKTVRINVTHIAERHKDSIRDRSFVGKIFKRWTDLKAKNIKVKAKDEGERMQTYHLVDNPFTKRVDFDFNLNAVSLQDEIRQQLINTYKSNKKEILKFVSKETNGED